MVGPSNDEHHQRFNDAIKNLPVLKFIIILVFTHHRRRRHCRQLAA